MVATIIAVVVGAWVAMVVAEWQRQNDQAREIARRERELGR